MLKKIAAILESSTGGTGEFCTKITTGYQDLEITIKDFGELEFPISSKTAKKLFGQGKPAKFGKRDQTIYDPQIRSTRKIPKSNVKIAKRSWNRTLNPVLQQVQKRLGIPEDSNLCAKFHEMLVYGPGDFFAAHQDTEKEESMVGTLVVLLPSKFKGGSLVIEQHGDKKHFRFTGNIDEKLTFIAFYADCYHQVKKVTSGYRIALIYNLIAKRTFAPDLATPNAKLTKAVKKYFEISNEEFFGYSAVRPRWLVYLLDHQYTQKSLSWAQLKGADQNRGAQLLSAAQELGLEAHLALADVQEVREAYRDGDYGYGYGRSRRRRYWDYYDDEDDEDNADVTVGGVLAEDCVLNYWIDVEGKKQSLGEHSVFRKMICWTKASDEFDPFESEYEGYMGNYGNTMEYWYHRAAIVLWQKNDSYASLFSINPSKTLTEINRLLKKDRKNGRDAIEKILPQWSGQIRYAEPPLILKVFNIAASVNDQELATKLILACERLVLSKTTLSGLRKILSSYGEPWLLSALSQFSSEETRRSLSIQNFLDMIKELRADYPTLASWLFKHQLATQTKSDLLSERHSGNLEIKEHAKKHCQSIKELLLAAKEICRPDLHLATIDHVLAYPRLYSPEILNLILREVPFSWKGDDPEKWGNGRLLSETEQRFANAIAAAKQEEGNWSIHTYQFCNCGDCKTLALFLENAEQQKYVWPLAKQRRRHIHDIIEKMGISVTHSTQRSGSPHKLILTKTTALFKNAEKRYKAIAKEIKLFEKFKKTLE